MKKIFTLLAIALLGLSANAEVNSEYGPCPAKLGFALLDASAVNKVEVELQLLENTSMNLNGFNMQVQKASGSESVIFRKSGGEYFSAAGYGNVILARWETTMGEDEETGDEIEIPVTDEMRENKLYQMCDVKSNVKEDELVIIEILNSNDCFFFPAVDAPAGIGKFFLNMSNCTDGEYTLIAPDDPTHCSFSFTRGPEPLTAWTSDAPIEITLEKTGDEIKDITGISTIAVDQPVDNRIFDLQGRELQSVPEHGIYIQNGKKYVK